MVDGHIHIERGEYTYEWVNQFVNKAVEKQLDEIWLLEHCYRFEEFVPMYDSVCAYSNYVDTWFHRNAGVLKLEKYLSLIKLIRNNQFPIKIKFGLEICYFKEFEDLVVELGQFTRNYTQTVKRAADNKRRYAPGEGSIPPVLLSGVSKGACPLAHDFARKV